MSLLVPQPGHAPRALLLAAWVMLCAGAAQAQHPGGGPGGPGMGGPGGMGNPGMGSGRGMLEPGPVRGSHGMAPSPARIAPQLGPPGRWWDDRHTIKTLNLRTDQQRRMDDIFEANKGSLYSTYANLKHEEERMTSMSREDLQDESKVFAAIDRIANARADMAKANAHVLLQLRKELDASQLIALDREAAGR